MYPWHNGQANAADISPILTYIIQKIFFQTRFNNRTKIYFEPVPDR